MRGYDLATSTVRGVHTGHRSHVTATEPRTHTSRHVSHRESRMRDSATVLWLRPARPAAVSCSPGLPSSSFAPRFYRESTGFRTRSAMASLRGGQERSWLDAITFVLRDPAQMYGDDETARANWRALRALSALATSLAKALPCPSRARMAVPYGATMLSIRALHTSSVRGRGVATAFSSSRASTSPVSSSSPPSTSLSSPPNKGCLGDGRGVGERPCSISHARIASRSASEGTRARFRRVAPVSGLVLCRVSHSSIERRSNVWPSATITGLHIRCSVMGQRR